MISLFFIPNIFTEKYYERLKENVALLDGLYWYFQRHIFFSYKETVSLVLFINDFYTSLFVKCPNNTTITFKFYI